MLPVSTAVAQYSDPMSTVCLSSSRLLKYLCKVNQIFQGNQPCSPEVCGGVLLLPAHVQPLGVHQ